MSGRAIWAWVLLRAARRPWILAAWLLALALVPLLALLSPGPTFRPLEVARDWFFPSGVLGALIALDALGRMDAFLCRLPGRTRWMGELGALFLASAAMQLPILAGALLARERASDSASLELLRDLPGILALDLHLAAVALLWLLLPVPGAVRVLLFALVTPFVSAFLADASPSGRALAALLDAGAAWRPSQDSLSVPRLASSASAAFALALAGYLVRTRESRAPGL
jgi:hypothetical protein